MTLYWTLKGTLGMIMLVLEVLLYGIGGLVKISYSAPSCCVQDTLIAVILVLPNSRSKVVRSVRLNGVGTPV